MDSSRARAANEQEQVTGNLFRDLSKKPSRTERLNSCETADSKTEFEAREIERKIGKKRKRAERKEKPDSKGRFLEPARDSRIGLEFRRGVLPFKG